jgi:hypothetical protein
MTRIASSVVVAALVVLAGCAGGIGGPSDAQASDDGTVAFYVSDERNAIDQFSHLNVTVTEVGFAGDANASVNATQNGSVNATQGEAGVEGDADAESEAGVVTRDVENRTVDLTELQGANATLLGNVSVPEGEYETVFVHVSEVNGTLENRESVNVKLPSQKLHVKRGFEADGAESVDYVFDITVFETGQSGKFVLKPVVEESGTDVPIEVVGESESRVSANAALDVTVLGDASAGENATVKVTQQGEAVADAELKTDEGVVATTDANGTAEVRVPEDGELDLEVTADANGGGEAVVEGELDVGIGVGGDDTDGDDADDSDGTDRDDAGENASADLAVVLDGSLTAGEQVTVMVTDGEGDRVENATVAVDGTVVGETNADGELAFDVPADVSTTSELTVTADGEQVTLQAGTVAAAN